MTLPFADLAFWQILLIVAAFAFGFFVRGAFGFGSNMPIILLVTWILGPHHAIVLVVLTSILPQLQLLPEGIKNADWKVTRSLLFGIVAGTVVGTLIFANVKSYVLSIVMGLVIIFLIISEKYKVMQAIDERIDLRGRPVVLFLSSISGFVGSVSGGGGVYFLVTYLKHVCPTPAVLRGTNITIGATLTTLRTIGITVVGFVTLKIAVEALVLVPVAVAATWAGKRSFSRAAPAAFYRWLQILLLGLALAIVIRGVLQLTTVST